MRWQQEDDLKKWEEVLVEQRVRPSALVPLVSLLFTGLGKLFCC